MNAVEQIASQARAAAAAVAACPTDVKNAVLHGLAAGIEASAGAILDANRQDLDAARGSGLGDAKLKRLGLSEAAVRQMAEGLRQVADLPDPVGSVTRSYQVPSGLEVRRVRCPLGVILMIYEARPNVTIDAFALCFKAGNACILKGGHEASRSNQILARLAGHAVDAADLPRDALVLLTTSDREAIKALLKLDQYIDLVIPRGGSELIRFVHEHSRIPTVQHFQGVCHIFVDASADLEQAVNVCATAKTSAPAACNAVEAILVHRDIAAALVPRLVQRFAAADVEVRGDPQVCSLAEDRRQGTAEARRHPAVGATARDQAQGGVDMRGDPAARALVEDQTQGGVEMCNDPALRAVANDQGRGGDVRNLVVPAQADDWGREFLDLIIAMKVVPDLDAAIAHIATYGSNHTDAILTGDEDSARRFTERVQSSCTLVNASTRFNDGFQLGLGAEIGISTSKIHAYGPMGLEELTAQRYVVRGSGQTR